MIFDFPYKNVDKKFEDLNLSDIEELQKMEIEALSLIYPRELKLLNSNFPYKIQININAFLENERLIFPADYIDYSASLIVEFSTRYPFFYPMFKIYSAQKELLNSPQIKELEASYPYNFANPSQTFLIQEMVEKIRDVIFSELKARYKRIRRIRHVMDPEEDDHDIYLLENDWSKIENLTAKAKFTALTIENFTEWNKQFLIEKKKEESVVKKVDPNKDKLTGKDLFLNMQNAIFVEENDSQEDHELEEFDLHHAIAQKNNEENVKIDEDVFQNEDELMEEMFN